MKIHSKNFQEYIVSVIPTVREWHPLEEMVSFLYMLALETDTGGSFGGLQGCFHMGVSIVMGYPHSWMFYKGKSHQEMDDLGLPPFQETPKSGWARGFSSSQVS